MASGGRETINFDESMLYQHSTTAMNEKEQNDDPYHSIHEDEPIISLSRNSAIDPGDVSGETGFLDHCYAGLMKRGGVRRNESSEVISDSSSADDIPGEKRRLSSEETEDEDDPSLLKLGLSRSRALLQRVTVGQSDSDDRLIPIAGPPLMNFNEPLLYIENNGGGNAVGLPNPVDGVAGDHVSENSTTPRATLSARALVNSEDDLVSQLGLETPSLRSGSNNGTICCRHLSNHNISIASLNLEANNFSGYCHNFGLCCAHGYRHKLGGGRTVRQRHGTCLHPPIPTTL